MSGGVHPLRRPRLSTTSAQDTRPAIDTGTTSVVNDDVASCFAPSPDSRSVSSASDLCPPHDWTTVPAGSPSSTSAHSFDAEGTTDFFKARGDGLVQVLERDRRETRRQTGGDAFGLMQLVVERPA